jgi:hypothetical protein
VTTPKHLLACLAVFLAAAGVSPIATADEPPKSKDGPSVPKAGDRGSDEDADFHIKPGLAIKQHYLELEGDLPVKVPGKRLQIRLSEAANKYWLLPVYIVKELKLPEKPVDGQAAVLTLCDALYHPEMEAAIRKAMDAKFGKDKWDYGTPIDDRARVTLWVKSADEHIPLTEARFAREADQATLTISFPGDSEMSKRLAKTDPSQLGITFAETYRGRFRELDLTATVQVSSIAAAAFQNKLDSVPEGGRATLLVMIGGGVEQKLAAEQYFARKVAVEVLTREGKEVNQTFLDGIVGKLFANLQDEVNLAKQRDDTVVTFLFSNGLKATASIGTFKGIKDQLRTEAARIAEYANSESSKDRSKRDVETGGSFGYGPLSASGNLNVRWEDEKERAHSRSQKMETRDVLDMAKAIEGELPVAVLNARQFQTLTSRAASELNFNLGTFRDGRKTLTFRQSFQAHAIDRSGRAETLANLQAKRLESLTARKTADDELTTALAEQQKLLALIETTQKSVPNTLEKVEALHEAAATASGMWQIYIHIQKVWGWKPPDGNEVPYREKNLKDTADKYQTAKKAVDADWRKAAAALKESQEKLAKVNSRIEKAREQIATHQAKIDQLDKELEHYIER